MGVSLSAKKILSRPFPVINLPAITIERRALFNFPGKRRQNGYITNGEKNEI